MCTTAQLGQNVFPSHRGHTGSKRNSTGEAQEHCPCISSFLLCMFVFVVERADHPLRAVHSKTKNAHSSIFESEIALALSRMVMNDLGGPSSLPPTLLVFGAPRRAKLSWASFGSRRGSRPRYSTSRPNDARLAAAGTARREYQRIESHHGFTSCEPGNGHACPPRSASHTRPAGGWVFPCIDSRAGRRSTAG